MDDLTVPERELIEMLRSGSTYSVMLQNDGENGMIVTVTKPPFGQCAVAVGIDKGGSFNAAWASREVALPDRSSFS